MSSEAKKIDPVQSLRDRLTSIEGVKAVDLTEYPDAVTVYTDLNGARNLAISALEEIVQPVSGPRSIIRLEVSTDALERRARFDSLDLRGTRPGFIQARCSLSWEDDRFEGEAEEESSPMGELRAAANATIHALERFTEDELKFDLVGVKEVHVFDHNFVVVLLHSAEHADHRLIGTSMVRGDRGRAASLAVLSATNRLVGNIA